MLVFGLRGFPESMLNGLAGVLEQHSEVGHELAIARAVCGSLCCKGLCSRNTRKLLAAENIGDSWASGACFGVQPQTRAALFDDAHKI